MLKINGELVVWHGGQLDFGQLQRRVAGPSRVGELARKAPASYVAFDVLQLAGRDLAAQPLRVRRRRLEMLLVGLSPPLVGANINSMLATADTDAALQRIAEASPQGAPG